MQLDGAQSLTATIALLSWPIITLIIFARSKTLGRGLIWSVISGQLLLPAGTAIKISMIPAIDKSSIVGLSALVACIFFPPKSRTAKSNGFGLVEIFLLMYVLGPVLTSQFNGDHIIVGYRYLPGVGLYDALSAATAALIFLIPFFLGRKFLRSEEDLQVMLQTLAVSGALYSVLLLFEIRFSPQLHFWVYGYYPSDFVQTSRDGGFRPMAFMGHGLLAVFFLMASLLAAASLWRSRIPARVPWSAMTIYLGAVLLICKSLGALIYGSFGSVLILFARSRTLIVVACILVAISLGYPMLRFFGLMPTTAMVELARYIDPERADSLKFRLDNEDQLLARALERPVFGWGRFGRNRVYDPQTGKDLSVTDGRWIIDLGQFGFVGFLAEFGLLGLCILRSARSYSAAKPNVQIHIATLTLLLAINIVDLLPNSGLLPLTWLMAGALLGLSEQSARRPGVARTSSSDLGRHQTSIRSQSGNELAAGGRIPPLRSSPNR